MGDKREKLRGVRDASRVNETIRAGAERVRDARGARVDIDLPELDGGTGGDIVADNLRALAALYFAAMLEELKLFAVADKVAEHFMSGQLPSSQGPGSQALYEYIKAQPERINEAERRRLYARAFGFAHHAAPDETLNQAFSGLWTRCLTALHRSSPDARDAARDLAVNLSLHGTGIARFAAVELDGLVRKVIAMLSLPDVLAAYGVRDGWQLVERVSAMYLGGAVNGVRQRTMAQSGSRIILWLAREAPRLSGPVTDEFPRAGDPEDREAMAHAAAWLAVTGAADDAVDQLSDAVAIARNPVIPRFALSDGDSGGVSPRRRGPAGEP